MTKYVVFGVIMGLVLVGCGDDEDPVSSAEIEFRILWISRASKIPIG